MSKYTGLQDAQIPTTQYNAMGHSEANPSMVATPTQHTNTHAQHTNESMSMNQTTMRDHVDRALANYFAHLDGHPVSDVYELVLSEVEPPLLEHVMRFTRQNQTRASEILGLNRGTLRKKLKKYGLLH